MSTINKHYNSLELYKILNRLSDFCSCDGSATKARDILPFFDIRDVERLIDQTETAYSFLLKFGAPSFGGISDINSSLSRAASGGALSLTELLNVARTLKIIRHVKEWRSNHEIEENILDEYFEQLNPNKYLEEKIYECILSDEEVSDHASPELANIRRKIRHASGKIRDNLDKLIRSKTVQKYLQEAIVTIRDGRFVIPVKSENKSDVPGIVHDTSSSGSTLFVEPVSVVEANNEIKVLQSAEREEIDRIISELSKEAGSFSEGIKYSYIALVELDLIFAKAKYASELNACRPKINDKGIINLKKARHPLLDPKTVVPIDIFLGEDFDTLIITGPNTGGKTVSLKTLGLLTLMTMCGLLIPVNDDSSISVFDHVLSDIGDEQSIEQSLSTFSAHMTNIIDILKVADGYSLVLLDELGAGTDPVEGAALAVAILETMHNRGAKIAATTHYSELKAYALQTDRVINGSCEFDVSTLKPTYKLLIGLPGKSNAFAILSRLGMEEGIIERSKELVSAENTEFEQVVESLQESHATLESDRLEAYRLRLEAQELNKKATEESKRVSRERDKILEQARLQARNIINAAREESARLLAELEELRKSVNKDNSAQRVMEARRAVKSGFDSIEDDIHDGSTTPNDGYVLPRPLKIGDSVLIYDIDKTGTVLSLPDDKGFLFVQAGIIKTKVNISNLRLQTETRTNAHKFEPKVKIGLESKTLQSKGTEIDIRGMMSDEALIEVDNFLDDAILSAYETVTIIHGKGTGALKKAVRQFLKTNPRVKSFRPGVYGEGEDGVTVVTLK